MVDCSSHYITYIDETSFYATAQSEPLLSIMNIHGTRRAGRRRRKACRLWTGGGPQRAYSGRGGGILCRHARSLFKIGIGIAILSKMSIAIANTL